MNKRQFVPHLLSALALLAAAPTSYASVVKPIAATGQTDCWNATGTKIVCTGTGQDGELRKGVAAPTPRFADNNDGTLTDTMTGLVWMKNANCLLSTGTWSDTLNAVKNLANGTCGLSDGSTPGQWRIPNVNELESLEDLEQSSILTSLNSQGFSNVQSKYYCTSTTSVTSPSQALSVYMVTGGVAASTKSNGCGGIMAVRGGQSGTYLNLNVTKDGHGSGTVTPDSGSIIWSGNAGSGLYLEDGKVTLTATPDSGSVFYGWSGACTGTAPCTVTMSAAESVTATFGLNGVCGPATTVRSVIAPTDGLCSAGPATTPSWDGRVWNWSCNGYEGGNAAACATPPPPTWLLSISVTGSGVVHTSPDDMSCTANCGKSYEEGTLVTLTPVPMPSNKYYFSGWSGACSGTGSCTVLMNQAQSVGATFSPDITPPVITVPADIRVEADSPQGKAVYYTVTVTDNIDPNPSLNCSPASGSTFPLGLNRVTCNASDAMGNPASNGFNINVVDTTPPVLKVPDDIDVILNTPTGTLPQAVLDFLNGASATDIVDTAVTISHSTPTDFGSVGPKPVIFTAVDHSGNTTTATANIHVVYGCGEVSFDTAAVSPFAVGSVIPAKLRLCDVNNADVTGAVVRRYVQQYSTEIPVNDAAVVTPAVTANTGNFFKALDNSYVYNVGTDQFAPGSYYLQVILDDTTMRSIPFAVK